MFPPTALTLGLKEDEVLLAVLCHFQTLLFLSPPKTPQLESYVIRLAHSLPFTVDITH